MTPPKGYCVECGRLIEPDEKAAYKVEGYEQERSAGGANHIVGRERVVGCLWHDRYKGDCFTKHLNGGQTSLLGEP